MTMSYSWRQTLLHSAIVVLIAIIARSRACLYCEVLRIEPEYTIEGTQARLTPFKRPEDAEHFFDGLRKAGLPER